MFSVKLGVIRSAIVRLNRTQPLLSSKQFCRSLSFTENNSISNTLFSGTLDRKCMKNYAISFSTERLVEPANPDVFGDISGDQYEAMELDEDEEEQEKFEMEETTLPRGRRMSPGRYGRLISDHIAKGDLYAAMNVLELIKENRDKPTTYMYNLLIRGFAIQGKLKKCFKLYNDLKKRALEPNSATYVSIFNACANSSERELAIEILNNVRDEILRKNVVMNVVFYNVMIKAYGKHQCLFEAFQLVDEMVDKDMRFGNATFNSLLFAAISNEQEGLKYALTVWHLMQQRNIPPTITTFNLLLRAMRDTKIGDLKINDQIIQSLPETKILLHEDTYPDLLAKTPIVTPLVVSSMMSLPPPKVKDELCVYKSSHDLRTIDTGDEESESSDGSSIDLSLNEIHNKNRLILFGGYTGFIERMEKSNVIPDAKTLTLLMQTAPPSLSIENDLVNIAKRKKIPLDIDFFNMLIKKRSSRRDYKNAKKVLDEIQSQHLVPDVITWGVLALGCTTHDEACALIEGMESTGHTVNSVIATSLLQNACSINHFPYIFDMLELMSKNRIRPTEVTYKVLDSFQSKISDIMLGKVQSKHMKNQRYKEMFSKFNLRYDSFQQQFGRVEKDTKTKKRQY